MNFSFLEVKSCCCFLSLRTGTKIIGYISLVGCLFLFSYSLLYLIEVIEHHPDVQKEMIYPTVDLVVQLLQAVTSFFLLLGVYQDKAVLIPWWLVTTILVAVLDIIFLPSVIWRLGVLESHNFTTELILSCLLLVDDIYGWLVVFSYYQSLRPVGYDSEWPTVNS